jgi:hypothetical protein
LVRAPNQYEFPIGKDLRLLDAISLAGGMSNQMADKIFIVRQVEGQTEPMLIQSSWSRAKRSSEANLRLGPGDVISVEQTPGTVFMDCARHNQVRCDGVYDSVLTERRQRCEWQGERQDDGSGSDPDRIAGWRECGGNNAASAVSLSGSTVRLRKGILVASLVMSTILGMTHLRHSRADLRVDCIFVRGAEGFRKSLRTPPPTQQTPSRKCRPTSL